MSINWSFVLNALLLTGVVVAIVRMVKAKRAVGLVPATRQTTTPRMGAFSSEHTDDIIAVRKVDASPILSVQPKLHPVLAAKYDEPILEKNDKPLQIEETPAVEKQKIESKSATLVLFLLAKENRQLAGYELLQTLLAAGLRFGEGQLFHRHQHPNGQGPVLCSLATATPTGVFDLQNIGAFSVHGLCLFMQPSSNQSIDAERFGIMLDTAKQLSEGLDTYLLDDQRKPWSDATLSRYYRKLGLEEVEEA